MGGRSRAATPCPTAWIGGVGGRGGASPPAVEETVGDPPEEARATEPACQRRIPPREAQEEGGQGQPVDDDTPGEFITICCC